jgi:hypothetical protein
MPIAYAHALMLLVSAGVARLGWFLAHDPERGYRIFLFGQEPAFGKRLAVGWSRAVGWMFTVGGCLGTLLYLVLIPIDLFHFH